MKERSLSLLLCFLTLLSASAAEVATDWPTYMKDATRSGVTGQELPRSLSLDWVFSTTHPPAPAWPPPAKQNYSGGYLRSLEDKMKPIKALSPRVTFDRAFHLVGQDGQVLFASSSEHKVVCLDLQSGATKWEFFTEAPVRLAPTLHDGMVLFGADDSIFYCLDLATGALKWKTLLGDDHTRLPGNERIISPWPIRTNAVVAGDSVFCCAGLFPAQGTYRFVLNLSDGKIIQKDKLKISPQGYINQSGEKFVVGGGRARNAKAVVGTSDQDREVSFWEKLTISKDYPYALIATPSLGLGGGDGTVAAFEKDSGKKIWSAEVEGKAHSLAIVDRQLLVSTDQGKIYCFSSTPHKTHQKLSPKITAPSSAPSDQVARIRSHYSHPRGYALLLGAEDGGTLACQLAHETELQIVVREADPAKAHAARLLFSSAGLHGSRIVVHTGSTDTLPYIDHLFNLVVGNSAPRKEIERVLRPQGGCAVFDPAKDEAWTKGGLEGMGEWTHLYANASNTITSNDTQVDSEAPLSLQWFGKPGPNKMIDRHLRASSHLSTGGRLFVAANDRIICVDSYNGTNYWERHIPGCSRLGIVKDSGNNTVDDNYLYVLIKDQCLVLSVETGKTESTIPTPTKDHDWGYLAQVDGLIFGSAVNKGGTFSGMQTPAHLKTASANTYLTHGPVATSKSVFAINKSDHSLRWSYESKGGAIINQSIVIGDGQIMFLESQNAATLHEVDAHFDLETLCKKGTRLVCLRTKDGGELWSESPDLGKLTHNSFTTCGQGLLIVGGSYTKKSEQAKQRTAMYDVLAFDLKSGRSLWTQTLDLGVQIGALHGVQNQRPILLEDKVLLEPYSLNLKDGSHEKFWSQGKRRGCGQISASPKNLYFRLSSLSMFNLEEKKQEKITQITRPGCWINVIPAGGVVLVPESSSGCTCDYAIQTSLAFMRR